MMTSTWYLVYATVMTGLAILACIAFVIDYFRITRGFRRSGLWWVFMGFPASLGILLAYLLIARFVPNSTVREIIAAGLFTAFVAVVPAQHRMMRKSMRDGERRIRASQPERGNHENLRS